jgi:iron complex transport system substrate-binding protein
MERLAFSLAAVACLSLCINPAIAFDYTLDIFGNANMDDTIDEEDVEYVQGIIDGTNEVTELADANNDGNIDEDDIAQIDLITRGEETELTIIDDFGEIVTVSRPLERAVVTCSDSLELLRSIKVESDRIVGVDSGIQSGTYESHYKAFYPEYQDKPGVGSNDPELMLSLDPDVVIVWRSAVYGTTDKTVDILKSAGIPVIGTHGGVADEDMRKCVIKYGYLFGKRDEAEEFIDWYEGVLNQIEETVEEIPEDETPTVYVEGYQKWYLPGEDRDRVGYAGGKNIFQEQGNANPEEVIDRNPDIIIKTPWGVGGYYVDAEDTPDLEDVRTEMMSRPELQSVSAVKDGRVYVINGYITTWGPSAGCRGFISVAYMAKWFNPDYFEDLDPQAIHQEYLTRFQGLDIDLNEKGVFVYPPL